MKGHTWYNSLKRAERRMKVAVLFFLLLSVVMHPAKAEEVEELKREVLNTQKSHVLALAFADYCKKPGIANVMMRKIADGIVEEQYARGFPKSVSVSIIMLAETQALGISAGISIAKPSPSRARALCALLVSHTDEVLVEREDPAP
jgi:hypothetical protein